MTINDDCRRVRELMDSYISGELSIESNHDVLRHLERCEGCRGELARRERMRALLVASFGAAPDAGALDARIRHALDRDQPRWFQFARYGGVAAALVLVAGLAAWLSRPVDAAAFDDSVDDHIWCALNVPAGVSYSASRAAEQLAPEYRPMVDHVAHRAGGYDLIDAHMCPYQGRNYAHLIYRRQGQSVSVLAEEALRGHLPAAPSEPRKGFVVSADSTSGHHVFVVTDAAATPPQAVVNELLTSALAFVRGLSD